MKIHPAKICSVLFFVLFCSHSTLNGQTATTASTSQATSPSHLLVSAEELNANLDGFQILDTRRADQYSAGHIPGARSLSSSDWMRTSMTNVRNRGYWESQLSALGISSKVPVVVVGDSAPTSARIWWLLKYFGLSDVRILDGGTGLWTKLKLPLNNTIVEFPKTDFKIEFQEKRLAELDDVQGFLRQGECQIIDSRSEAEYTGRRGVGARTGHIPGAVNFEWSELLDADGKYLAPEEMRKLLTAKGIDLEKPLAAHCQTGGRSSVSVFAFELLGAKDVKNYYLGWSEYGNALTAPVEK